MAGLSDYAERAALDALFTGTLYVALFTAAPDDSGGGTEVSTGGYARKAATFAAAATAGGVTRKATSNSQSWTASGANYGTLTHGAIFDAVSGGNMLAWGALPAPRVVNDGDSYSHPTGAVIVTMD